MRIRYGAPAFLVLVSFAASPFVANAQQREARALEGFDAVEVGGGIDVELRQGQPFVVEVQTRGELANVITELRGSTLVIRRKSSWNPFRWNDDAAVVHVTLPALVALTASGGSDVTAQGTFSSETLAIVASGGSDVTIAVAAGVLEATTSGGSDLRLTGSARTARVHSSGGSDLNASQLTADEADVHSSGGSDLMIAVRDRIVGSASGGSDITYSGAPRTVEVNASGGSDVRRGQ